MRRPDDETISCIEVQCNKVRLTILCVPPACAAAAFVLLLLPRAGPVVFSPLRSSGLSHLDCFLLWGGASRKWLLAFRDGCLTATGLQLVDVRSSPTGRRVFEVNFNVDRNPTTNRARNRTAPLRSRAERGLPGVQAAAQGGGVRVRSVRLPRLLQGLRDEGRNGRKVRTSTRAHGPVAVVEEVAVVRRGMK